LLKTKPDALLIGQLKMMINGHNLHVEQLGPRNGCDVVLLHHGLGSTRTWREQMPMLAASGFRVTAYDRWGYGESDSRARLDLPGFESDVSDLHRLFQELGIRSAALIGHSDGGTIAMYFAVRYPGQVRCLVTIAAHIYVELKMEPGILSVRDAFLSDARFRHRMSRAHGSQYEQVFHNWFDGWHRIEMLGWDMRPVLRQICCPALVIQGEADEHAMPQHAKDIADAIPGAELWLVPAAGHMLVLENPGVINPRLLEFLQKCAVGTREV
jgi:pimeloyl-ACP methyl ester carboxylesterase